MENEERSRGTNLSTAEYASGLKQRYVGEKINATNLSGLPIKIHHVEFSESKFNLGKEVAYLQVSVRKKMQDGTFKIEHRFLMTESYFLINTLKRAEREKKEFPYYSKIILRRKDNKFSFVKITEKEKEALIDIPDPTLEN